MDGRYTFDDFREIITRLRGEAGCPWDKVQTHESLKPCMMNEMTEAVAAVNILQKTGDATNLCEELGDLLLLIMLQSEIAKEEGYFTIDDVVKVVSEKMIRRHPHVFGAANVRSTGEVLKKWEEIKKQEKVELTEEQKNYQKMEVITAAREVIDHLRTENP